MSLPITPERRAECETLVRNLAAWGPQHATVAAIAIVGSWARGTAHMDSDLDVIVLADDIASFIDEKAWISAALKQPIRPVRTAPWGVVTERRVELPSGLQVEFGIATPAWASTNPIDSGTRRVVTDGCRPIHDPHGLLSHLITALEQSPDGSAGEHRGGQQ